jgi:hypothetical protein
MHTPRHLRLTVLLLGLLAWACAEPQLVRTTRPDLAESLVLNLGNRSGAHCDFYRNGAFLGRVPPGSWLSIPFVPAGDARLRGVCGGREFSDQRELRPPLAAWAAGAVEAPLEDQPALLLLSNPSRSSVEVFEGPLRIGHIAAGGKRAFPGIAPGTHELLLRDPSGRGSWVQPLKLEPGVALDLAMLLPSGSLRLQNNSDEFARLQLGEGLKISLPPGAEELVEGVAPGRWQLQASLGGSGKTMDSIITVEEGKETLWTPTLGHSTLEVENRFGAPVQIFLDGELKGRLEPDAILHLEQLRPGVLGLRAVPASGAAVFDKVERLLPGAIHRWILQRGGGLLRVRNTHADPVRVFIDGSEAFSLKGGADASVALSEGVHQVDWLGLRGGSLGKSSVEIGAEYAANLDLGPGRARFLIINGLEEPASLYLNGRFQAELLPGAELTIFGLMEGESVFEATTAGRVLRHRVLVQNDQTGSWALKDQLLVLEVKNESGETLTPGGQVPLAQSLAPGEAAALELPEGEVLLAFTGATTGFEYVKKFKVAPGKPLVWRIPVATGELGLSNHSDKTLELILDGKPVGELAPGADKVIKKLSAGDHEVLVRADGAMIDHRVFFLRPQDALRWDIAALTGSLKILNRSGATVELKADGRSLGKLPDGGLTEMKDLPVRPFHLEVFGAGGAQAQEVTLTPSPLAPPSWIIEPMSGSLRIEGVRNLPLRISIDGAPYVELAASSTDPVLPLRAGWHSVAVAVTEGAATSFKVPILPGRVFTVNPISAFSLQVDNRGKSTILLQCDGELKGEIPPGASMLLAGIPAGRHIFKARTKAGEEVFLLRDSWFRAGGAFRWRVPDETVDQEN